MTLNDYQKAAERTSGNLTSWDKIRNGCYGLNGEAGECIDILKKVEFQGHAFDPNKLWASACEQAEKAYFDLLAWDCTPQEARAVLPNSLKTEVVMTADLREWRHFLRLRCSPAAHPDMRVVAFMLLVLLKKTYPVFFEDIEV